MNFFASWSDNSRQRRSCCCCQTHRPMENNRLLSGATSFLALGLILSDIRPNRKGWNAVWVRHSPRYLRHLSDLLQKMAAGAVAGESVSARVTSNLICPRGRPSNVSLNIWSSYLLWKKLKKRRERETKMSVCVASCEVDFDCPRTTFSNVD